MIASRFNISVPDFPDSGKHLLYNTRSQAQVVVDNELRDALAALPAAPAKPETRQAFSQLEKMGFIVPSEEADVRALEKFFATIRDDNAVLRPTVLTTYACNFRCTYCIEQGVKQMAPMSQESASAAAAYIIEQFKRLGSRQIALTFYGGEPLMNIPAIRTVARTLKTFADAEGVPFGFGFSTNGSLLTPAVIEELKPLGMTGAKITLDGPREVHDRNRPFRNGRGSFDLLLDAVRAAVDLTEISIEINFNDENAERVGELLDLLASHGLERKIKKLLFSPISAVPQDRQAAKPGTEVPCAMMTLESTRRLLGLQALAVGKGFPVNTVVVAHVCEMTTKPSSFTIDPAGTLYRCGGLVGREEFSFGSLGEPENDRFMGSELWRRCTHCAFAPLCGDGCPFGAYVTWGDPFHLTCGKPSMELFVRESLKLTYLRRDRKQAR